MKSTKSMQQEQNPQSRKRRSFLKQSLIVTGSLGLASAGTLYYAHTIEPAWFDITHYTLRLPRLTPAFHNYRLVHMTDIHTDDTWMTASRLADVVRQVNELHADAIAITGDFLTFFLASSQRTIAELSKLQAKDGVFGVLGNHDHPAGVERMRACLQAGHVRELPDAVHTIRRADEMLHLVGLDDLWPTNRGTPQPIWSHLARFQNLTATVPEEGAAVLLVHEPDFADVTASVGRYDLQLSGHSHGGQVRLPFYGAIALPPLSRNYPCGIYHLNKLVHYTNRGIGMLSPRVRLNCRPEIAIFELHAY